MKGRTIIYLFLIAVIAGSFWFDMSHYNFHAPNKNNSILSANISAETSQNFIANVFQKKIRVLIVPGHEPDNGGTNFGNLYERNLVVPLAEDLQGYLDENNRYETFITRDAQNWNQTFADYFQNDWNQIISWEQNAKKIFLPIVTQNQNTSGEVHNNAATDDAMRLYGINKWADDNNIDLMIHVHFNNYPGAPKNTAGKYSGIVMYMPAPILKNSAESLPIAKAVFKRLSLYNPISNLPVESKGLEEDNQLIAMGAYNTAKPASMLIEYDYIYEPQFVNPKARDIAFKDLAYQTYLGLQDYFNQNTNITAAFSYNPSENVYAWNTPVVSKNSNPVDIYAMQTALIMDGDYPPRGMTKNKCPHSGALGACTTLAVEAFQKKYKISGEDVFGTKTFNLLNNIYNNKAE